MALLRCWLAVAVLCAAAVAVRAEDEEDLDWEGQIAKAAEQAVAEAKARSAAEEAADEADDGSDASGGDDGDAGDAAASEDEGEEPSAWTKDAKTSVIVLTDQNFDEHLSAAGGSPLFVKFYAPWCSHCQAMAGDWEKTAETLKGRVRVAKVDATNERGLSMRFNIQGYPTIKLFAKNQTHEYTGSRVTSQMIDYATGGYDPEGLDYAERARRFWDNMMKVHAFMPTLLPLIFFLGFFLGLAVAACVIPAVEGRPAARPAAAPAAAAEGTAAAAKAPSKKKD